MQLIRRTPPIAMQHRDDRAGRLVAAVVGEVVG
jgi:hypothetical protein